jgi:hypothetical protein
MPQLGAEPALLAFKADGLARRLTPAGCVWDPAWVQPYMSVWSLWSKLCDLNAFTSRDAASIAVIGLHRNVFAANPDAHWLCAEIALGWEAARHACMASAVTSSVAIARWLRYCPACAAMGYHAACFQHLAITRCPAHDAVLFDRCPDCGAMIQVTYEAGRVVPFGCAACGHALRRVSFNRSSERVDCNAIAATTRALLAFDSNNATTRCQGRSLAREARPLVGHATWWGGPDPYVRQSTWRPRGARVAMMDATNADSLNMKAWSVMVNFLDTNCGASGWDPPLAIAAALEAGAPAFPTARGSAKQLALALLVLQYGGARAWALARHRLAQGVAAHCFAPTPQRSRIVESSADGNAMIVQAELRQTYLWLLRHVRRQRRAVVWGDPPIARVFVPWLLASVAGDRDDEGLLQWRELGERRFQRALRRRVEES